MVTEIKLRELNNQESKSEKIYTSSSKKVREYFRENRNGENDDVNDEVTINNVIRNSKEGDEEYDKEKERKIVNEEEE